MQYDINDPRLYVLPKSKEKILEIGMCKWLSHNIGEINRVGIWYIIANGWYLVCRQTDPPKVTLTVDGRKLKGKKRTEFILRFYNA